MYQTPSHRIINNMIIQRMGKIEDMTQKMFHDAVSRDFEEECINATDTLDIGLKNRIIARLNDMIDAIS